MSKIRSNSERWVCVWHCLGRLPLRWHHWSLALWCSGWGTSHGLLVSWVDLVAIVYLLHCLSRLHDLCRVELLLLRHLSGYHALCAQVHWAFHCSAYNNREEKGWD